MEGEQIEDDRLVKQVYSGEIAWKRPRGSKIVGKWIGSFQLQLIQITCTQDNTIYLLYSDYAF